MSDYKVQKALIVAGLAVLLIADGALLYYNSTVSARDQNPELVLKNETRQLDMLKADVARASKIKAKMPEVQKYFDEFETTLPESGKGYSVLSQEFAEISREAHVQVEDLKFHQKDVKGRNMDEVSIDATLNGDYSSIVKLLNRLQRSKNTYVVDSLGLDSVTSNGPPAPGQVNGIRVALKLKSYFRKA